MASTTTSTKLSITFSSGTTESTKTTVTSTVSTTNGGDKVSPEENHEQNQALSDSTDSQGGFIISKKIIINSHNFVLHYKRLVFCMSEFE